MKYLAVLAIVLLTRITYSQEPDTCHAGVYITQDDFIHNRLSYKINTGQKGNKLDFTIPSDLTLTLKLITPDTTYKFPPGSIYGYNECGKIFRYYPGQGELNAQEDFYRIEEAKALIIYSSVFISDAEVFYSTDFTAPIHRLTLKNLKNDFRDYPEFIDMAKELNKKVGDGLATRDENGAFLINKFMVKP